MQSTNLWINYLLNYLNKVRETRGYKKIQTFPKETFYIDLNKCGIGNL